MNDILYIFLSLSLSGSILALILLVVKLFNKNRLSQTWQYYIWLVVILRFLLPFSPQTSIVGEIIRQLHDIKSASIVSKDVTNYEANEDYIISDNAYNQSLSEVPQNVKAEAQAKTHEETPSNNKESNFLVFLRDILNNVWLLWVVPALVLFVHKLTSYRSFVRFVNAGKNKITDTHIWSIYTDELTAAKIKRPLPIYINKQVFSPMLVGFLHPILVLPILETSDDELRQILRHELTHFKRWDYLYKWIVQITLCLHWFNPLVYLINNQINKSCELSCDESVIKHLDVDGRITYGDALMASLTAQGKYSDFVVSINMSKNVDIVKERLNMIMSYKKKSRFIFCIAAMLTAIMFYGFTFTGAYVFGADNTLDPITTQVMETSKNQGKNKSILFNDKNVQETDKKMKQVIKEYTLVELKALNVSGITVDVLSENVLIERGGDKLIIEYFQMSDGEYIIDTQPDMGGKIEELSLCRTTPADVNEPVRTINIIIPDKADFIVTAVSTDSGIIRINGCVSDTLNFETKSGEITIIGGFVAKLLMAKTLTGSVNISGIATGDNFRAFLESDSGEVFFQPQDKIENYQFIIDTVPQTRITVNDKDYKGGDFKLNNNAVKKVCFDSISGLGIFTVQDAPVSRRVSSLEKNFEKYEQFGVVYSSALDAVYYNGERVRLFVDFKQNKEESMDYAFDLCFQDRLKLGTLCLEAMKDKNGKVIGIRKLDDDIASELLLDLEDTLPLKDNKVLTFDATLVIESYDLWVCDLTKDKAPTDIKAWMIECDKQQGAYVKESKTKSGYITYIYSNQGGRYPWNIDMHDGKVCVYLYDSSEIATSDGYTLLYYTAPTRYDIRLFLEDGTELNY